LGLVSSVLCAEVLRRGVLHRSGRSAIWVLFSSVPWGSALRPSGPDMQRALGLAEFVHSGLLWVIVICSRQGRVRAIQLASATLAMFFQQASDCDLPRANGSTRLDHACSLPTHLEAQPNQETAIEMP
jgi:hypothetical protein